MKRLIICILLLTASVAQAYDPTADEALQAWWRLGDGAAIGTDSGGKGNTLENYENRATTSETAWEGTYSTSIGSGVYLLRSDGDLSSAFPLKSGVSGDFSICLACRFSELPGSGDMQIAVGKYRALDGERSFQFGVDYSSGAKLFCTFGYGSGNTGQTVTLRNAETISTGVWYHIGITYNASTRAVLMRVWDDTAQGQLDSDDTDSLPEGESLYRAANQTFYLARRYDGAYGYRGLMDDVVVFNKALSTSEIDKIRAQTFGDSVGGGSTFSAGFDDGVRTGAFEE